MADDLIGLIARVEEAGVRLRLDKDGQLRVWTPPGAEGLVAELRPHRETLVAILTGEACSRCGSTGTRLVQTYWTDWRQALCVECIPGAVAHFDQRGWPPSPSIPEVMA
jgi:hypothetical protein